MTANFDQWGSYLLRQLERLVLTTLGAQASALLAEVSDWPNVRALRHPQRLDRRRNEGATDAAHGQRLVPFVLALPGQDRSMFSTLATPGSPLDVTLSEMTVELFYPANDATAAALRYAAVPDESEKD